MNLSTGPIVSKSVALSVNNSPHRNSLREWIEKIRILEKSLPVDEEKLLNTLQSLTKTFVHDERYHQDPWLVKQWFKLADKVQDTEKVFEYMQENGIGSQLTQFYEAYSVVLEKKRDFIGASEILLLGKELNAQPTQRVDECINKFEYRMRSRLKRDFYERGLFLKENESSDSQSFQMSEFIPNLQLPSSRSTSTVVEQNTKKRRYPFDLGGPVELTHQNRRPSPKRQKLNPFLNTISTGAFRIYVDEPFRSIIPTITKLVSEYQTLCMKHQFQKFQDNTREKNSQLSWISLESQQQEQKKMHDVTVTKAQEALKGGFLRAREKTSPNIISIFDEPTSFPTQSSTTRLNLGSFDLGSLAAFLFNDESSLRLDSKNLINPDCAKFDHGDRTINKDSIIETKAQYKKTPFHQINSEEKTPRCQAAYSQNNDSAKTKNPQLSAEKPSLNVSRSLNFEEDTAILEGVRMNDVNIQKFQKSPFCQGLFGEEDIGIAATGFQKHSKTKRILQKTQKIEYLRSSENQPKHPSSEILPSHSLLVGTAIEEIRSLPKGGDKLEDLEFAKFMQKLLQSPSNLQQSRTFKNNEPDEYSGQIKQARELPGKDENQKAEESQQNDFAKTLSYMLQGTMESDKENILPERNNLQTHRRSTGTMRKALSELPLPDFVHFDAILNSDVLEVQDSQTNCNTEEQLLELTEHSTIDKFSVQNSQTLSESNGHRRSSNEEISQNIEFIVSDALDKEKDEGQQQDLTIRLLSTSSCQKETLCDQFLAGLLNQKGILPNREKRGLSLITEHSRESESSGFHTRNSINSIFEIRKEDVNIIKGRK